ncbi:hypothetical protein H632_c5001p0, partial [Helicosporidium sp. ATCC 50920]
GSGDCAARALLLARARSRAPRPPERSQRRGSTIGPRLAGAWPLHRRKGQGLADVCGGHALLGALRGAALPEPLRLRAHLRRQRHLPVRPQRRRGARGPAGHRPRGGGGRAGGGQGRGQGRRGRETGRFGRGGSGGRQGGRGLSRGRDAVEAGGRSRGEAGLRRAAGRGPEAPGRRRGPRRGSPVGAAQRHRRDRQSRLGDRGPRNPGGKPRLKSLPALG